jgi:translation initiation factor IF-3
LFSTGAFAISTNFRHNHQIRISPIFLIDQNDVKVGIISTGEALKRAQEVSMDLVEVAPTARPPVCKIMDYGKWRYQQQKKEDKSRASSKGGRLKMLNIDTIRIGDHDLLIKMNRAKDFLKDGNKVQFTLRFKGRELAHIDLGRDLMNKVKHELWPVSKVERDAKMEGKRMTLVLMPDNKPAGAKPPPPAGKAPPEGRPAPFQAGAGLNLPPRGAAAAGVAAAAPAAPSVNRFAPVGAAVRAAQAAAAANSAPPPVGQGLPIAGKPVAAPAPAAAPAPVPEPVSQGS